MFRRKSAELRELHEVRVADLKEAHEAQIRALNRLIEALAEQVEYLRAQMGRPTLSRTQELNPSGLAPAAPELASYVSEVEEDILALQEFGHISDDEAARLLREELQARAHIDLPDFEIS